jgi:hypothetical protein
LSDQEHANVPHHREGEAVVFDPPENEKEAARRRREDEQHEFARSQVKTNTRLALFTGALVLTTLCTIAVGIWQASISQKAVDVASRTLDETVRSNKTQELANMASFQATVDNFHLDQRAWVGVISIEPPNLKPRSDFFLSLHAINSGHTPALNFQSLVVLHSLGKDEPFKAAYGPLPAGWTRSNRVVQPGEQVTINTNKYALTQEQVDWVTNGNYILYVYGKMSYDDVFGKHHHTTFCKMVISEALVEDCGTYNTAD